MYHLGAWSLVASIAFWLWGIEVKGRSIDEIDNELTKPCTRRAGRARGRG
jgi:hypothetical protein